MATEQGANGATGAPRGRRLALLCLGALGVVYGDIGTSPLYAIRECFWGEYGIPVTADNVLGVLSLVLWALIIVVTLKYLSFILRADNHGEGGVIALMALVLQQGRRRRGLVFVLVSLGLFGASLLYGDGMITPAISVLSAVEGLHVATPLFDPYVVPITVVILIGLFLFQRRGTGSVGAVFGPVTLLWFAVLAVLGLASIARSPAVLAAVSPHYGLAFVLHHGVAGFLTLGGVFLVVTGAEALYADLGHFGRRPIRVAWYAVVLPSLLANYFGHGAWFPLAIGLAVFTLLSTWQRGRAILARRYAAKTKPYEVFFEEIEASSIHRVPGRAVYMTGDPSGVPPVLLHNLAHNKVLHEEVVLLTVVTEEVPRVPAGERIAVDDLGHGFFRITARYGFMDSPSIPHVLGAAKAKGLDLSMADTSFFLGRETPFTSRKSGLAPWRAALFRLMNRNSLGATAYFRIPHSRVVEIGAQIEV